MLCALGWKRAVLPLETWGSGRLVQLGEKKNKTRSWKWNRASPPCLPGPALVALGIPVEGPHLAGLLLSQEMQPWRL